MIPYLIFGITFAFAAAVQPGPLQTFFISQTLSKGWKRTLPAAFAPLLSDGPIIILVLFILSQVPAWLATLLQTAGGLFLLYLAYATWQTWKKFDSASAGEPEKSNKTLFQATFINLLNPNPYLGWSLVMGPLFLKGWAESPVHGAALLISFYSTIVITSMAIIFIFAAARQLGPRVNKVSLEVSAIALGCFGLYDLWLVLRNIF